MTSVLATCSITRYFQAHIVNHRLGGGVVTLILELERSRDDLLNMYLQTNKYEYSVQLLGAHDVGKR